MNIRRALQVAAAIVFGIPFAFGAAHVLYYFGLNMLGPSTQLWSPMVMHANPDKSGYPTVFVGDELRVGYRVKRHKLNGDCKLDVQRIVEHSDGPTPGKAFVVDTIVITFIGKDEDLWALWPTPPRFLAWPDYILPEGVNDLTVDLYVKARYHCNIVDDWIPRWLQGGSKPNETVRASVILRRSRP